MTNYRRTRAALGALALLLFPFGTVSAQRATDVWAGLRYASGAGFGMSSDGAMGATAGVSTTWKYRSLSHGTWLIGAGASAQTSFDRCPYVRVTAVIQCVGDFPNFYSASALSGWQIRNGNGGSAFRLLVGLGAYASQERVAPGISGQFDVSTPQVGPVALAVFGQSAIIPNLRGHRYRLHSFGLSLRVQ